MQNRAGATATYTQQHAGNIPSYRPSSENANNGHEAARTPPVNQSSDEALAPPNYPNLSSQDRHEIMALHRRREVEADKENKNPTASQGESNSTLSVRHQSLEARPTDQQQSARAGPHQNPTTKPRTFIDTQDGRTRVEFDDPSQPAPNIVSSSHSAPPADWSSSPVPTQDAGFEQDERPVTNARRRPASSSVVSPNKRARTEFASEAEQTQSSSAPAAGSTSSAAQQAGPATLSVRGTAVKAPQAASPSSLLPEFETFKGVRRAWSARETRYLINEIEAVGCKWSTIKDRDVAGILAHRDQVGLKDKARNLKIEYLR